MFPPRSQNRNNLRKNVTRLQIFPSKERPKSACIDIHGTFILMWPKNEHLLVIMDLFSKMTKTVPMKGIYAAKVAKQFVNSWVFNYRPPEDLIADNGGCSTSKYFQNVCRIISIMTIFTTTYHPQTNGHVEIYNRAVLAALQTNVTGHTRDWDLYTDVAIFNCIREKLWHRLSSCSRKYQFHWSWSLFRLSKTYEATLNRKKNSGFQTRWRRPANGLRNHERDSRRITTHTYEIRHN